MSRRRYVNCTGIWWIWLLAGVLGTLLAGCSITGKVVDLGNFETTLSDIHLDHNTFLKVYYGGSRCEIPLSDISSIIINPAVTITVEKELYFNADITLKDGTRLKSLESDKTAKTMAFVCVHHELLGKHNGELFRAGFERIQRLTIY